MEYIKIADGEFTKTSQEEVIRLVDLEAEIAGLVEEAILAYPVDASEQLKTAVDLYNEPIIYINETNFKKKEELQNLINELSKL